MTKTAQLKAETARERQAQLALDGAKGVLRQIELLAEVKDRPALDDASTRFCNLVALALFHSAKDVTGAFDAQLKVAVDELRGRLLDMGTNMMIEKIRKVHQRAESVLRGGAYPLGLADSLRFSLDAVLDNMQLLGAWERLSDEDKTLVEGVRKEVAELAAYEARYGMTITIDDR